ncbi:porin [Neiella sp. HB171785]|uniref:Porin n=1 Tax=Neiella litorisoli TaxID=2771431 RepID=A0A8J6R401_9GAMM|nr:porin [Neiella litorisoli]MBD1390985.1 porin [Neiella litorisoli]
MTTNKLMTATLASLACCSLPAVAAEASDQERIKQLEQQVAVLQAQQNSSDLLDRFTINGFASVGFGIATEDLEYTVSYDTDGYGGFEDDKIDFAPDSMVALQMSFDINDQAQAVVQLVGRGVDSWDPEVEWAYISYTFDNDVMVRGGRLRLPIFMLSDYLEVGYAYPFARPSVEVYNYVPSSTYEGFDLRTSFDIGSATLTLQPFVGQSDVSSDTEMTEIMGTAVELSYGNFGFRTSIATTSLESDDPMLDDNDGDFLGFGASWDNGDWLFMGEWTRAEVDGAFPDYDSYYVSLAYRYDVFTPYVMYANSETQDDNKRAYPPELGLRNPLDSERTAYSLGLRWDFAPAMALKFDATLLDDFGSTAAGFSDNVSITSIGGNPIPYVDQQFDDAAIYSVVFDVIF